jgi:hypothetical protein
VGGVGGVVFRDRVLLSGCAGGLMEVLLLLDLCVL